MPYFFEEDIRDHNIFQLAGFILRCRTEIQKSLNLYSNDSSCESMKAYEDVVTLLCQSWEHHSEVYSDIYESNKYKKALLWMSLQKSKYILKTKVKNFDISDIVYELLIEKDDSSSSFSNLISDIHKIENKRISSYEQLITTALKSDDYRKEVGKIISMERYKENVHSITVTTDYNIENIDVKNLLKHTERYEIALEGIEPKQKQYSVVSILNDLLSSGITKQTYYDYINGDVKDFDKKFFVNLAFFLYLSLPLVNKLFENDGYNIKNSKRLQDKILMKCYRIGFSRDYANVLLKNAGFYNEVKKTNTGYYYLDIRPMGK
jgi:predicted CopG family antitoxin